MKKLFFCSMLFVAIAFNSTAQDQIRLHGHGGLLLTDGTELNGVLKYSPVNPGVVFFQETENKWKKYKVKEVTSFDVEGKSYKSIKDKSTMGSNPYFFMELIVPADYQMKVYRYQEQNGVSSDNNYAILTKYFVQFPGQEEVLPAGSMKLMPFHKKGPKYVESCSRLTELISKKANGYKIGMVSSEEMKATVFKQVAEDYQNCN